MTAASFTQAANRLGTSLYNKTAAAAQALKSGSSAAYNKSAELAGKWGPKAVTTIRQAGSTTVQKVSQLSTSALTHIKSFFSNSKTFVSSHTREFTGFGVGVALTLTLFLAVRHFTRPAPAPAPDA